jgi:hypothetical protein
MKIILKHLLMATLAFNAVSCVAYMESQAARKGQTGDPTQGGYFGFSEQLSDQRISNMESVKQNAQNRYETKKAEEIALRRQLAEAEARLNHAATAEARILAQNDINRIRKKILVLSSN